jgi:UDP-N-acetylmuramate dehydrogenase
MTGTSRSSLSRLAAALEESFGPDRVVAAQPLSRHTSLGIGGPADLLITVQSAESLRLATTLAWDHGVACRVLGGGSNILISDAGIRGLTILNRARNVVFSSDSVRAESGALLSTVARLSIAKSLAGLEWASGIPGTVGGALVGNAGAWGGNVASTLRRATVLERNGQTSEWPVDRFHYDYRSSILKQADKASGQDTVILESEFALKPGERGALQARVAQILDQRQATQPPGATCGSVFKNPPGDHAGRLIEAAGLKGVRRGQAEISTLHANYVVNRGDAKATDVKALFDLARQEVQARFGISLQPEIQLLGDW